MALRSEIRNIQSQLKSAIQNHQMILFKLKDRPCSINLRVQMSSVQRHIVSLGEKQKKLLQQLRKELEASGTSIKYEKPFFKPLQNIRPNPLNSSVPGKSLTVKKEEDETQTDDKPEASGNISIEDKKHVKPEVIPHSSRRKSKLVATVDLPLKNGLNGISSSSPSQKENTPSSTPSSSPTNGFGSNRQPKQSVNRTSKQEPLTNMPASDESQDAYIHLPIDPELRRKLQFMTALSLVTREVLTELQNRRTERKRRSTANPQFLYGNNLDQAMKRKKTIYLASNSNGGAAPTSEVFCDPKELVDVTLNLTCLSCSSGEGSLSHCTSCQQAFHWNCFDDTSTVPAGQEAKCSVCLKDDTHTFETNGVE